MRQLSLEEYKKWLDDYGEAWQKGDADAAIGLFSDGAEYYETPFDEPMVGKEAIHKYWSEGAGESQRDVRFLYEVITVRENKGVAQWHASFVRIPSGTHVELDGILVAEFDDSGRCLVFREWWHRWESEGGGSP
jgi:ketosteroid isomerase-like protein